MERITGGEKNKTSLDRFQDCWLKLLTHNKNKLYIGYEKGNSKVKILKLFEMKIRIVHIKRHTKGHTTLIIHNIK